jgi:tRNA (guanine-N7-)-methyltransferase
VAKSAAKTASSPGFDPWLSSQRLFQPYVWPEVFGRTSPVELDLGAGDGVYVEARAHREPDRDFVAVERLLGRATKIAKKAVRGRLGNLRILRLESAYFLKNLCPPGSVDVITLRYPDPWPKRRHHGNRILTRDFAADAARACQKGGRLQLTTDDREYFDWACREVAACPGWRLDPDWTGKDEPTSEFEEKFQQEGRAVLRRAWIREG